MRWDTDPSFGAPQTASTSTTSYQITGLTPNTTYYVSVNASNVSGTSNYSSSESATTESAEPATDFLFHLLLDGNDAITPINSPTLVTAPEKLDLTGYAFNGINQQLQANTFSSNLPTIGSGAFSINIWAQTSSNLQKFILGAGNTENVNGGFHIRLTDSGDLIFRTKSIDYSGTETYNDGVFNMITITSDTTDIKIYKNSVLDNTISSQGYNFIDEGTFRIAATPSGGPPYWNGSIDGCRVYDRVLTDSEIVDLYNYSQI